MLGLKLAEGLTDDEILGLREGLKLGLVEPVAV